MSTRVLYIIGLMTLSLAGCKKYLDKEPDNRTQVRTPDQIAQLLTTAYPKANYMLFCESMSDNAEDKEGGGSGYNMQDLVNRQSYLFEEVTVSPQDLDGPDFYWNSCYKAIAAANQALQFIAQMEDQDAVAPHKGEALVARAYAHFMLVTLFAKVYDPSTATNYPGIPYVTEPETEVFKQYDRHTVAYVYDMIEKDLTDGYPLISDAIYGNAPKFHFNRKAAAAFAARFYLFKRDFEKVITYASEAIGNDAAANLRPWNGSMQTLQYAELQAAYARSTTPGNLLLQETNSIWGRSYYAMRFGIGATVTNSIFERPTVTSGYFAYPLYGGTPQAYNVPKLYEYFVTETINANSGEPYNTIPLFTVEEALLNRAEAYLYNNDNPSSIADLNAFASKNIIDYDPALDNLTASKISNYYQMPAAPAILNAILDFKKAFFLHEGIRWFDIIRLNIPVIHRTRDGIVAELPPDDNRRVLQLPVLTKQAGLEPNPR